MNQVVATLTADESYAAIPAVVDQQEKCPELNTVTRVIHPPFG